MSFAEPLTLELAAGARVRFSTRAEGNLSSTTGVDADGAEAAREHLREGLGLERLVGLKQVHGTTVLRDRPVDTRGAEPGTVPFAALDSAALDSAAIVAADGCATATPGVGAMVLVADCLPVALGTPGAVAMLHAGWRGLRAGVLEEGVRALRELGGDGEIAAAIGPGAGVCCYEVGEEVHTAFGNAHRQGRRLDLRALARERLLAAGVTEVHEVELCTICERGLFSHRREAERSGRQAGVAWLS